MDCIVCDDRAILELTVVCKPGGGDSVEELVGLSRIWNVFEGRESEVRLR